MRELIESDYIVVCADKKIINKYDLSLGNNITIHKPIGRIADIQNGLSGKKLKLAEQSSYEYETIPSVIGLVIEEAEANFTIYVSFSFYKQLFGENSGKILSKHIKLSDEYLAAKKESEIDIYKYKSSYYTNDFIIKCEYLFDDKTEHIGDLSDVLLGTDTVALRCSRSMWDTLGYEVGDSIQISGTGRIKVNKDENISYYNLSRQLENLTYSYDRFKIVAVIIEDVPRLEVITNPLLYQTLTDCTVAYDNADIELNSNQIDSDIVWQALRKVSGNYYEAYVENNNTVRINALQEEYHRDLERGLMKIGTILCMIISIKEYISLFDERRKAEMNLLSVHTGNIGTLHILQYGIYIPLIIVVSILWLLIAL